MKRYTKIYLQALGYDTTDFIPCELTGERAVDIHHIEARGMGGDPTKSKDRIENLMALSRNAHIEYGDNPRYMAMLYKVHESFLQAMDADYDREYMLKRIEMYEALNKSEVLN